MHGIHNQNFLRDLKISWEPGSQVPRDSPTLVQVLHKLFLIYGSTGFLNILQTFFFFKWVRISPEIDWQGGKITGNLGTRFPRNLKVSHEILIVNPAQLSRKCDTPKIHKKTILSHKKNHSCDRKFISCHRKFISCLRKSISCDRKFISRDRKFISCDRKFISCQGKFISCHGRIISCHRIFISCSRI